MSLPDLGALTLAESESDFRAAWKAASGTRPQFGRWKNLSGKSKWTKLHSVARAADVEPENYVSAYQMLDIDDIIARGNLLSVEHVVPRSMVNGSGPGLAENDPLGWIEATPSANAIRSNLPLVLWPGSYDGPQPHFSPPESQRARLARKWLFIRLSYSIVDTIDPPSKAQTEHRKEIIKLAKTYPIQAAERRVNEIYHDMYNYSNPLLKPNASRWYDSKWMEAIVFGGALNSL